MILTDVHRFLLFAVLCASAATFATGIAAAQGVADGDPNPGYGGIGYRGAGYGYEPGNRFAPGYRQKQWHDPTDWYGDAPHDFETRLHGGYYDGGRGYDEYGANYSRPARYGDGYDHGYNYFTNDMYSDDAAFDAWYD